MITKVFLLLLGFVLLIKGANYFVLGSSSLATNYKVPKKLIGLISYDNSVCGKEGTRYFGIGINIFNICFVLGLPVAIFGGITPTFSFLDIAMLLLSSIILFIFSLNDYKITKLESVIMVMICIFYYICIFL